MMPMISVERLSKRYQIGKANVRYRTLRESVMEGLKECWGRVRRKVSGEQWSDAEAVWALRDVEFEVRAGEVVGLIGRNGAGKSTLLKVLSQITKPTAGQVELRGRVASLLEVGTGFHPELTGRENIYLNGAILGMSRQETRRKFDEIVEFAEVGRFLETPVKRYSSGMYTRLAFSVAAHLEPDILIIDEVLAVGDAAFQKKCLGKMGEVSRHGRTVLFVSHNMTAVKQLCTRALLIDAGRVVMDGGVDETIDLYLTTGTDMARTGVIPEGAPRHQDVKGEALFRSVRLTTLGGQETDQLYFGQPFRVTFVCEVVKDIPDGHWEVSISTRDGTQLTYSTTMDRGPVYIARGRREVSAAFSVELLPREYTIDLGVHHRDGRTADFVQRTLDFTVLRVAETGAGHYPWPRTRGLIQAPARWEWREGGDA